jgi:hypothetical protein
MDSIKRRGFLATRQAAVYRVFTVKRIDATQIQSEWIVTVEFRK